MRANAFHITPPTALAQLFTQAGLQQVETRAIDVPTVFRDFDDYWTPFLGGQGPAPGYVMSLSERQRVRLRNLLRSRLPTASDGSISLNARAWAVKGNTLAHERGEPATQRHTRHPCHIDWVSLVTTMTKHDERV